MEKYLRLGNFAKNFNHNNFLMTLYQEFNYLFNK